MLYVVSINAIVMRQGAKNGKQNKKSDIAVGRTGMGI